MEVLKQVVVILRKLGLNSINHYKVTIMVLKVDLHCSCCYKKIKRLLCKFPQIKDQTYDEKQNQVIITVVCCSPEKIRDKLCCKGGKVINSIDIKEPPKPEKSKEKTKETAAAKPPAPQKEAPKPEKSEEKTKETTAEKLPAPKKEAPKPDPTKKPEPTPHLVVPIHVEIQNGYPPPFPNWGSCCGPCSQGYPGGPCFHGTAPPPPSPPRPCCGPCSQGYPGGPCFHGTAPPPPSPPRSCYDSYGYGGGNRGCYVSRCEYFSEENPRGCTIM